MDWLVVEQVDEQGVVCRSTSAARLLEQEPRDQWIALQVRVNHQSTQFQLTMQGPTGAEPLIGGEVWLEDLAIQEDSTTAAAGAADTSVVTPAGKYIGPPDLTGSVRVAATGLLQKLQLRVGSVTVWEQMVLAGAQRHQALDTSLTHAHLLHARALADSRDDLVRLRTQHAVYLAREQHRRDAGRTASADALREEMDRLLRGEVAQLKQVIQQRRREVAAVDAAEADRLGHAWGRLTSELNALTATTTPDES